MVDDPTWGSGTPQSVSSESRIPAWVPRATYIAVPLATILILIAHTFQIDGLTIDTTTIGLLALMLLVPLAPHITRLKAAGVEAEIGPREAQRLQASAADLPPASKVIEMSTEAPSVQELIRRDPPLGLAKLRIDLEREIKKLHSRYEPASRRPQALGSMTRDLQARDVLPPEIAGPLAEVNALANRAVHGEYVPRDVAEDIADVGLRVLSVLQSMTDEMAQPEAS